MHRPKESIQYVLGPSAGSTQVRSGEGAACRHRDTGPLSGSGLHGRIKKERERAIR